MKRTRHRLRHLAVAFGALALTAQWGINSPQAEASTDLRFWHFNMCGNKCWAPKAVHNYLPDTDSRGEVTVRADQIVESVRNYSPDIVTLNEACYSQYRAIRAALVAQGYHATYASSTTGKHCVGHDASEGDGFGMALFSKQPIAGDRETHKLGDTKIHALCADTALGSRSVKACSVHLVAAANSSLEKKREKQATELAALAADWHATRPVVLMGDFNAEPADTVMDKFYGHTGGRGIFHEADESDTDYSGSWPPGAVRGRSGEITFSKDATKDKPLRVKKIDYIFLSAADFGAVEGDSLYGGERRTSDHRVYRGGATWQ